MAIRQAGPSSSSSRLLSLVAAAAVVIACLISPANAFTTSLPSRVVVVPPSSIASRPLPSVQYYHASPPYQKIITKPSSAQSSSSYLHMVNGENTEESITTKIYTPLDRPLLATIDTISLTIFAAIGKSSHSPDGSLDLLAVLFTAFPFITAWLTTSPLTGVYSPDDRDNNMVASTALKVAKGWVVAVPLGIVLRGVIKGYVPPVPFIVVTLVATLVILAGVRIGFSFAEDFFVEFV